MESFLELVAMMICPFICHKPNVTHIILPKETKIIKAANWETPHDNGCP